MHGFRSSQIDPTVCVLCKRPEVDHTTFAECEACGQIGPCELFADNLYCAAKCYPAEIEAQKEMRAQAAERVNAHNEAVRLSSLSLNDLMKHDEPNLEMSVFNAKTLALVDMLKAIDENPSIENKYYAKAEFTRNRFKNLQAEIFERERQNSEARAEQKAIHVYLNEITKSLKQEEREKLHLQDIQYPISSAKPKTVKPKAKPEVDKTGKPRAPRVKVDVSEIKKWAALLDVTQDVIHMRMIQHNMTAEQAARTLAAKMGITLESGVSK